jgi:hypothetical protein
VIPVPSRALRAHLEAERERRARAPQHPREREDAPPEVLRDLWRQLVGAARALGLREATPADGDVAYDPALYRRVYERVLAHRRTEALELDTKLETAGVSPYHFSVPTEDLVPAPEDVARCVREVEERYRDPARLEREIQGWYRMGGGSS